MEAQMLKVGELAKRTGLSVRTLHHYDEIGLLVPSARTRSGHRLYGAAEIARLQRIVSLKQLGFSLEEIAECLARPEYSLDRVIALHIERLESEIELQGRLRDRLERLAGHLRAAGEVSLDELVQTIEVTTMLDKYYTKEQQEQLAKRRQEVGAERIRQVEAEWQELIGGIRAEMERGADVESEPVKVLARRWNELAKETMAGFTGGDRGLEGSLRKMYSEKPAELGQYGLEPDLLEYVAKATAALKTSG